MIDTLFTAALAFCVLIGGTLAIGSALRDSAKPALTSAQTHQPWSAKVAGASRIECSCAPRCAPGTPAAC
jgi:hypothetical protein